MTIRRFLFCMNVCVYAYGWLLIYANVHVNLSSVFMCLCITIFVFVCIRFYTLVLMFPGTFQICVGLRMLPLCSRMRL